MNLLLYMDLLEIHIQTNCGGMAGIIWDESSRQKGDFYGENDFGRISIITWVQFSGRLLHDRQN